MMSIKDAAMHLAVCTKTIHRLIRTGKLDARKLGRRTIITIESLDAFVASLPVAGGPVP